MICQTHSVSSEYTWLLGYPGDARIPLMLRKTPVQPAGTVTNKIRQSLRNVIAIVKDNKWPTLQSNYNVFDVD